jgi:hypothetical protein
MVKQFTLLLSITGMQWNQMADTGGYKEFRMAQANMYYFAKACLIDKRCIGMFFTKGRRTGFTEMALDHLVQLSTTTKIKVRYYIKI